VQYLQAHIPLHVKSGLVSVYMSSQSTEAARGAALEEAPMSCLRQVAHRTAGTIPHVRLDVLTAVTMKNGVFWDVTPCGSCKNRVSEELSVSFISVTRIGELRTTLAVTSNRRTLRRNTKQRASVASYS
jgi:hypothetical protein